MNRNSLRIFAALFAAMTLASSGPAMAAAESTGGEKPDFTKADQDGNGKISMKEAKKAGVPKSEAKEEDINNDGNLTKADWHFVDMKDTTTSS